MSMNKGSVKDECSLVTFLGRLFLRKVNNQNSNSSMLTESVVLIQYNIYQSVSPDTPWTWSEQPTTVLPGRLFILIWMIDIHSFDSSVNNWISSSQGRVDTVLNLLFVNRSVQTLTTLKNTRCAFDLYWILIVLFMKYTSCEIKIPLTLIGYNLVFYISTKNIESTTYHQYHSLTHFLNKGTGYRNLCFYMETVRLYPMRGKIINKR